MENVKIRVNFGAVFLLEGVVFLIQSIKQKLFSSIIIFKTPPILIPSMLVCWDNCDLLWAVLYFLTKIENDKKRVNFGAVFLLEGVVFLIQSIKQKLFSSIFYFQNTPDFNS